MQEALLLIKNGWPPDLAFSLTDEYRQAFCIAIGLNEGGTFDWSSWTWEKRS